MLLGSNPEYNSKQAVDFFSGWKINQSCKLMQGCQDVIPHEKIAKF